jgi:GT2 family glycosyltransferase
MPINPDLMRASGIRSPADARRLLHRMSQPTTAVTIRRKAAFGDVLMATPLAKRFADFGHHVRFGTLPTVAPILSGLPFLSVTGHDEPANVLLDNTYETNLNRKTESVAKMFFDAAAVELRRRGIPEKAINLRPHLVLTPQEVFTAATHMSRLPRPWTVFIPKSVAWKTRTLSPAAVRDVLAGLPGSVFLGLPDAEASLPAGKNVMVTAWARTFRDFAAVIANADLVVTADTGPMHVAAALGKPIVALQQSIAIEQRLNDQVDYIKVAAPADCSPCNDFACRIPGMKDTPPCMWIEPTAILSAAKTKLRAQSDGEVSVIIPAYKPSERIYRCVDAVKHQVAEVYVSLDGGMPQSAAPLNAWAVAGTGKREGYGKTCNRAARHTNSEYILFLNDDCYLDQGSVQAMRSVLATRIEVAVVGALLRYPDGKIQHGGMFRGNGGYGHIDHMKTTPTIKVATDCEAVTFAAAMVRRSAFFQVGGFDEEYDCYSEDVDLCMKLRRAGWKVVYQPLATGIHEESQSTSAEKNKMLAASHVIMRRKWGAFFSSNLLHRIGTNFAGTQ